MLFFDEFGFVRVKKISFGWFEYYLIDIIGREYLVVYDIF